jgi:hypothetical protein
MQEIINIDEVLHDAQILIERLQRKFITESKEHDNVAVHTINVLNKIKFALENPIQIKHPHFSNEVQEAFLKVLNQANPLPLSNIADTDPDLHHSLSNVLKPANEQ